MNKLINKITAILSLTFISAFGILTLFSEKLPASFNEDRELAETPVVDMKGVYDGSTMAQLSSYITDHFAGRRIWVAAKTDLQTEISESIVNGVYVSRKRLLDVDILQREPSHITGNAKIFNAFSEKYEGTVYFAAIPTSTGVYGDVLPTHVAGYSEKQQITDLYEALGNDIRKIDAYDILKMVKDNYIYYRNDTKWTSYGAYCVYKTVVQKLGFSPISYDKFSIEHVTDKFRGNLYNRTLSTETTADTIDIYSYMDSSDDIECQCIGNDGSTYDGCIFDRSKLDSSNMYSIYLGDKAPVMKIKTNVNNGRKLLVIKDSYGDCFIPFLLQHYGEIAVVSPDALDKSISQAIDINEYGQTLFLFSIESLGNRETLENIIERT